MITIIDYDTGNLLSVTNALERVGAEYKLSSDIPEIARADKIILPGVGEASNAMERLRSKGLTEVLQNATQLVLGICLGMQIMCSHSEEADTECLGIFPNRVKRFDNSLGINVPHMGWNAITDLHSPLYEGVDEGSYVYYVHSYFAEHNDYTIATSLYGLPYSGSIRSGNFFGCQFHPEKSGTVGEKILNNFLKL